MARSSIHGWLFYPAMVLAVVAFWFWLTWPLESSSIQSIAVMSLQWYKQRHITTEKRYGYFLHITDMHIDESYLPGATVDSDCHRFPSASDMLRQQRVMDANGSTSMTMARAGTLGTPGAHCDSPIELARQTLDWIQREWRDKLDFVIWTGDNARHDWDDQRRRKRKHIYRLNEEIQEMMMETFAPTARDPRRIPLVPAIGNNDIHPHNYLEKDDHGLLAFYSQLWQPWIPDNQQKAFQQGGYFAVDVAPQLRVLSMNTLYFYRKNDGVRGCRRRHSLAHQHMTWFANELARARRDGVKVLVMGHVPPSPRDYRRSCFEDYTQLSAQYADIIRGHLYGHLNMDHFLLYGDATDDAKKKLADTYAEATRDLDVLKEDEDDDEDAGEDNGHDPELCINRNIEKYVGWLHSMYSSLIDDMDDVKDDWRDDAHPMPPESKLVVVHVSPSVLPVYLPTLRIFRYEINQDDSTSHAKLLGYDQFFANITEWDHASHWKDRPLVYSLEYTTEQAYGLRDLTPNSYYDFVKRLVQDKDNETTGGVWSSFIKNMFVQTLDHDLTPV
ncbi:Metallo-dependent phosphatase-like protein [Gongronella butleri]|nr:Metallo-dependent phosphatase-like protein [Gongronella butleri]